MDIDHRIGFEERDEAARRLSEHHAAGRLEIDEFEERVALALKARTVGDLIDLFHDLPDEDWMIQGADGAGGARAVATRTSGGRMVSRELPGEVSSVGTVLACVGLAGLLLGLVFGSGEIALLGILALAWTVFVSIKPKGNGQTISFVEGDPVSEVRAMVYANRKIAAIKRWRELHPGLGLAEAKADVEAIERGQQPRARGQIERGGNKDLF